MIPICIAGFPYLLFEEAFQRSIDTLPVYNPADDNDNTASDDNDNTASDDIDHTVAGCDPLEVVVDLLTISILSEALKEFL